MKGMIVDWDRYLLPSILAVGASSVTGGLALLGGWLANRNNMHLLDQRLHHEQTKEKHDILRERLEELYSLVGKWSNHVGTQHLTYQHVMLGKLSYNQALDLAIASKPSMDANRMFTLAHLYFPTTRDALDKVMALRDEAASIQGSFKREYEQGSTTSAGHAKALGEVLTRFDAAIAEYQALLAEYAADIDPSR